MSNPPQTPPRKPSALRPPSTRLTPRSPAATRLNPQLSSSRSNNDVTPIKRKVLTPSGTPLRSDQSPARSTPRSSMKEQIAAKRRELQEAHRAKKSSGGSAATTQDGDGDGDSLQDSLSALSVSSAAEDQDIFGRSLSHLIHKSLRTGRLNICSMELERLPKQLWTKVLGMPDNEITLPSTPPVGDDDDETVPSYEVEDLTQLKAASNMLKEIEPEIGFFASLRILDLKDNRLRDLPASVANLLDLTLLDISRNDFTQIPRAAILLPRLVHLDISSNAISAIDFSHPIRPTRRLQDEADFMGCFPSTPTKLSLPGDPSEVLFNLKILKAARNRIDVAGLPDAWPAKMQQLDLAENTLAGRVDVAPLARLGDLRELSLRGNDVVSCLATDVPNGFAALQALDLAGNKIKEVEWIGGVLDGRTFGLRGVDEWQDEGTFPGQESEHRVEVSLANNPLSSSAVESAQDTNATLREASVGPESDAADDFVIVDADPVRRRLFGTPEKTHPPGATSPAIAPYWDERQGCLDLSAEFCNGVLDDDGTLDLAKLFNGMRVSGKLVSLTVRPLLAIKSLAFPSQPIAALADVTALTITYTSMRPQAQLFRTLHRHFPSLQALDLSGSLLEDVDGLPELVVGGLKSLRLKDGKLNDLSGLEAVARDIKSSKWRGLMLLSEVDVRDNDIARLDPVLGWLPLTSFQVDGNAFRVPTRRVYERGTAELLRWLRDRMEG